MGGLVLCSLHLLLITMRSVMLLFALFASAAAHPSYHADFDSMPFISRGEVPPVQSYHIHVNYARDGELANKSAAMLREAYIQHFGLSNAELCQGMFKQDRMCLFKWPYDEGCHVCQGPFLS